MKFVLEFEMKEHHCHFCPFLNSEDLCDFQSYENNEGVISMEVNELLKNCPLKQANS